MKTRFRLTSTLVLLIWLSTFISSATPQHPAAVIEPRHLSLSFNLSFAVSDFDQDHRLDQAKLNGTGQSKSIEIDLSHTRNPLFLHFKTVSSEAGSLITRDIDNDGDADLIWSDRLHPDDVIVWLGDGLGQFERTGSAPFAQAFILGSDKLKVADEQESTLASTLERDPVNDQEKPENGVAAITKNIFPQAPFDGLLASGESRQPTDRGPPLRLS
ncbi:MAG: VCBS repeat-containing protein [Acidobacteria bacterium]|nr:VCBS repeat-containing protein [Acidobacteriota bacterium]